jgi:antitoxin component YwqK of YwqJK toxin-antitoxin module
MKILLFTIAFSIMSFFAMAQDDTIKFTAPRQKNTLIEKGLKPNQNVQKPALNGQHILYNTNGQKTKDGFFKDNRFLDGKNYKYNENGKLTRIEIYKDGVYIGDAEIK